MVSNKLFRTPRCEIDPRELNGEHEETSEKHLCRCVGNHPSLRAHLSLLLLRLLLLSLGLLAVGLSGLLGGLLALSLEVLVINGKSLLDLDVKSVVILEPTERQVSNV